MFESNESSSNNDKIINKIRKLQEIANKGISNLSDVSKEMAEVYAREATAAKAMAERLLTKYSLSTWDLKNEREQIEFQILNQVGKSILANPYIRANARNKRCLWFEELARVVAENNSCKIGIEYTGETVIYGFSIDRDVAILIFEQLARVSNAICDIDLAIEKKKVGTKSFDFKTRKSIEHLKEWIGDDVFIESFHAGFREEIVKNFENSSGISEEVNNFIDSINNNGWKNGYNDYTPTLKSPEIINDYVKEFGKIVAIKFSEKRDVSTIANSNKEALVLKSQKRKTISSGKGGVLLAIDCSSSMDWGNDKMGQAKRGAFNFAKSANEQGFAIGIIKFDSEASLLLEPTLEINGNFERAISKLVAQGGTNMTDAISEAMNNFVHRSNKRILVIITDGQPNNAIETLKRAQLAKAMGIEIRTIGTDDANADFLRQLASNPNLALKVGNEEFEIGIGNMAKMLGDGKSINL